MKYRELLLVIAAIILVGCSSSVDTRYNESITEKRIDSTNESITETDFEELIEVKIINYDGDTLTFIQDGNTMSSKMTPERFANDTYSVGSEMMSEKIINNHFGITPKGYLKLDKSGQIKYCDVYKANGDQFDSSAAAPMNIPYEDTFMNMKRIKGSEYEFSNDYLFFTADLNYLNNDLKSNYGEEQQGVEVIGYRFNTGEIIIESISIFDHKETIGGETQYLFNMIDNYDKYNFFGTIRSLSDEYAEIILNDKKTICDVPIWYRDGELKEGMQVMITLNTGTELFGSGKEYRADFAVIYTDPEEYNYPNYEFEKLAYSKISKTNITEFVYTKIGEDNEDIE